jgi:hypothetical protein
LRLEPEITLCEKDLSITLKPADGEKPAADREPTTADLVARQEQIVQDLEEQIIMGKRNAELDRHQKEMAAILVLCSAFEERVGKAVADLKITNAELSLLNAAVIGWSDFPGWDFGTRQILNNANGAYEDDQMKKAAAAAA